MAPALIEDKLESLPLGHAPGSAAAFVTPLLTRFAKFGKLQEWSKKSRKPS